MHAPLSSKALILDAATTTAQRARYLDLTAEGAAGIDHAQDAVTEYLGLGKALGVSLEQGARIEQATTKLLDARAEAEAAEAGIDSLTSEMVAARNAHSKKVGAFEREYGPLLAALETGTRLPPAAQELVDDGRQVDALEGRLQRAGRQMSGEFTQKAEAALKAAVQEAGLTADLNPVSAEESSASKTQDALARILAAQAEVA